MAQCNAENERIKREYAHFLVHAQGYDDATIDRVMASLWRFEEYTRFKAFGRFRREQAIGFKAKLAGACNARTGEKLSKATVYSTLRDLKTFFEWLSREPGFRSTLEYSDAAYFNLSEKDTTIARARRVKRVPTLQQVEHVLATMFTETALERRDRALIAMAMLTGARGDALASFRLGHYSLAEGYVDQDARVVRTKFAKTFRTYLMPVSNIARTVVEDWACELRNVHLWGEDGPLFPATEMTLDENGSFQPKGLARHGWADTGPVRAIFRRAFLGAGIEYYNPHSFRDMLVHYAMSLNLTPEEFKAWSQNLGHANVMTTLTSYGQVDVHRQGNLIRSAGKRDAVRVNRDAVLEAVAKALGG